MDGPFRVRLATPADAAAITKLVERCYGTGYADARFLDAGWVSESIAAGRMHYAVAEDGVGRHVGQVAIQRLNEVLYEHSKAIVVDEHRGRGLMGAMSRLLLGGYAGQLGVELLIGHSVTTHVFTQRCTRRAGYRPLGLLLGMWPARCIAGLDPESPPVSALLEGLWLGDRPRARQLALRGGDLVKARAILRGFGIDAEVGHPRGFYRPLGFELTTDEALGLARVIFSERGALKPGELPADVPDARWRTLWADVPAEHPEAPRLVAELRRRGFTFAAYLPLGDADGCDVLRLQRYRGEPISVEALHVLEQARPLCAATLSEVYEGVSR